MYKKISAIILILIAIYIAVDETSNKKNQKLIYSENNVNSNKSLPAKKNTSSITKRTKLPTYELHKFMSECPILDKNLLPKYVETVVESFEINIPSKKEYFILYRNQEGELNKINSSYSQKIPMAKIKEEKINNTNMLKCIILITGWPTGYKPTEEKLEEISKKTSYDIKGYEIFLPLDICPPEVKK